jgi:hypothetical protein
MGGGGDFLLICIPYGQPIPHTNVQYKLISNISHSVADSRREQRKKGRVSTLSPETPPPPIALQGRNVNPFQRWKEISEVKGARSTLNPAWGKALKRLVKGETWFLKVTCMGRFPEYSGASPLCCDYPPPPRRFTSGYQD